MQPTTLNRRGDIECWFLPLWASNVYLIWTASNFSKLEMVVVIVLLIPCQVLHTSWFPFQLTIIPRPQYQKGSPKALFICYMKVTLWYIHSKKISNTACRISIWKHFLFLASWPAPLRCGHQLGHRGPWWLCAIHFSSLTSSFKSVRDNIFASFEQKYSMTL